MKATVLFSFFWLAMPHVGQGADPLRAVREAIRESHGSAFLNGILLAKSEAVAGDPDRWFVFGQDPHRAGELVKLKVERDDPKEGWQIESLAAGQLLQRVPTRALDLSHVLVGPMEARRTAEKAAELAQVKVALVQYQLAAKPETGAAEWGLFLFDEAETEVGFVVVSAETGALVHQDMNRVIVERDRSVRRDRNGEGEAGEEAARAVKDGARRAWDWTERARRETKGFFKELFR